MANEYIKDTNSACNIDFYVRNKVLEEQNKNQTYKTNQNTEIIFNYFT